MFGYRHVSFKINLIGESSTDFYYSAKVQRYLIVVGNVMF